jgi:hypothetical protein
VTDLVYTVAINSFWILGLALLVAAFSYHYDQAQRKEHSLRAQLSEPSFNIAAWAAATLIGIGLIGTSMRTWEALVWLVFTLFSFANTILTWRARSSAEEVTTNGN